jgi:WhiB family redox-sensing transcriptional regulator
MSGWTHDASCRGHDPELWHPVGLNPSPVDYAEAVEICAGCPVRTACAEFADRIGARDGVWAGVLRDEAWRKRMARRRAAQRASEGILIERGRGASLRSRVAELTDEGYTADQIAQRLHLKRTTVKTYQSDARCAGGPARCGTDAGYYRHLRNTRTEPCRPCIDAHTAANRGRRQIRAEAS